MKGSFSADLMEALKSDAVAQMKALRVLMQWAGQSVYLSAPETRSARRIRAAHHMLKEGMLPADIAEAIATRFNVSHRQARRDIAAAGQKP